MSWAWHLFSLTQTRGLNQHVAMKMCAGSIQNGRDVKRSCRQIARSMPLAAQQGKSTRNRFDSRTNNALVCDSRPIFRRTSMASVRLFQLGLWHRKQATDVADFSFLLLTVVSNLIPRKLWHLFS